MRLVIVTLLLMYGAVAASADGISLKRGISTDTWVTWPAESRFGNKDVIDSFPEWRTSVSPAQVGLIRRAGFDFVRLTLDPAIFLHQRSAEKTGILLDGVQSAIASLRAQGLKVIVDLHSIPAGQTRSLGTETYLRDAASFAAYLAVVADVGHAIAEGDRGTIAFEPINEPMIDCAWERGGAARRWPALAARLHAVARAAAPRLTLIMQGGCWGSAEGLTALNPTRFNDANIIWAFHSYAPMIFTHQGADWTSGVEAHVGSLAFPPRRGQRKSVLDLTLKRIAAAPLTRSRKTQLSRWARHDIDRYFAWRGAEAEVSKPFRQVKSWARKHGISPDRIMLGEFGAIRSDGAAAIDPAGRAAYLESARILAEKEGWAWAVWSWGGSFGITESDQSRLFPSRYLRALGLKAE